MWKDFYAAGGWGMHPIALFGLAFIALAMLDAIRPDTKHARALAILGILTFAAGLLGTATGIATSFHYVQAVAPEKQVEILALGCAESLHDLVFALMLDILGGLLSLVSVLRQSGRAAPALGAARAG
jgi:hypothetical protein